MTEGNIDDAALPELPPYDLFLTIIGGQHIPVGDLQGKSDGYVIAKVKNVKGLLDKSTKTLSGSSDSSSGTANRGPIPSPASRVHFRTSTKRGTRDPEWNESWRIGGVRQGTYIKLKLYDEDPHKRLDDKLGSVKYVLPDNLEKFVGADGLTFSLPTRNSKGAKHIQVLTHAYDIVNRTPTAKSALKLRIKLLPPTFPDKHDVHLVNPTRFSIHLSPLVNLVASAPQHSDDGSNSAPFKAYKINLIHPPPSEALRFSADASHAKSFDPSKLRYRLTHHFIRKQYQNIYGYNSHTVFGGWWGEDLGRGLVELLQPHVESKIFTFVIVRDGEWRFCETGDQYKVNKLSKHSMHADGQETVTWGGEFFVKKTKDMAGEFKEDEEVMSILVSEEGKKHEWTICLDNDSGTYSPDADYINEFRGFMTANLKGINVIVVNFKSKALREAKEEQKTDNDTKENSGEERKKGGDGRDIAQEIREEDVMPPDTETEANAISRRLEAHGISPQLSPTENAYIADGEGSSDAAKGEKSKSNG